MAGGRINQKQQKTLSELVSQYQKKIERTRRLPDSELAKIIKQPTVRRLAAIERQRKIWGGRVEKSFYEVDWEPSSKLANPTNQTYDRNKVAYNEYKGSRIYNLPIVGRAKEEAVLQNRQLQERLRAFHKTQTLFDDGKEQKVVRQKKIEEDRKALAKKTYRSTGTDTITSRRSTRADDSLLIRDSRANTLASIDDPFDDSFNDSYGRQAVNLPYRRNTQIDTLSWWDKLSDKNYYKRKVRGGSFPNNALDKSGYNL